MRLIATSWFLAKPKNSKGYALIEILLAFGLSTIVMVAMVSLAVVTVRAATTNRAYAEAGKVAQSQAERLKLMRDTSTWSTFTKAIGDANCTTSCRVVSNLGVLSIASSSGEVGTGASKVTYFFYTVPGVPTTTTKEIKYTVVATWNISTVAKTYKIEGLLSDWKSL